jgi:nicotinate (nicotinamide) nucleotide adenylyltransferase
MSRIGIYAGTFDPVHTGHISFALQSLAAAHLDKVYFVPERRPRNKQHIEHFAHRVAMIKRAIKPHRKFAILELVDVNFSIEHTLPELRKQFPNDELVFLFGSDIIASLAAWPHIDRLLLHFEIVVGLRNKDSRARAHTIIESWPTQPKAVTIFPSYAPKVSSGQVREALRKHEPVEGLLTSVERYSDRNWLYISLA